MKTLVTHIVPAGPEQLAVLRTTGIGTFTEAFASVNTEADMALYLKESFDETVLLKELEDPDIHYYLAYVDGTVAGYLKLNFGSAQKETYGGAAMEIERVYVLKAYQGRNIGQALMEEAFSMARAKKIKQVWLGVWEKNPGAIKFYKRNGFAEYGSHVFRLGTDEQTDILMKLEL